MRFSATLRLRPVRIAFLVNPRDFTAVRYCIRLNSCLWGGWYNPIIPVFDRPPARWNDHHWKPKGRDISRGYMRFFEPEVVVEAEPNLATKVGWEPEEQYLSTARLVPLADFVTKDNTDRLKFASGVDINAIHSFLYHEQYKYQLKREEKFAIMQRTSKRDAFFDVTVGIFPEHANLSYIERNYIEGFRPVELSHSVETFLSLMEEPAHTPLSFTRHGLEEDFGGFNDLRFFVFDPSDAQDLIDFWNLRQFARDVIPIHVEWLDRCAPLMHRYIEKNFRPIPGNPFGTMFDATVEFARSIAQERAEEIIKFHFQGLPPHSISFQLWYQHIWDQGDFRGMFRPKRVRVTTETLDINENISEQNLSVSIATPTPEFLKKGWWFQRATWTNVIQPRGTLSDDDELATVYPTNILDPKFPRLRLADWAAVSREGWVFPDARGGSEYLQLQLGHTAFVDWFARQGIEAIPSDAGRVAEQIIRSVGGLRSCVMFADEAIVKLLDDMAATRVIRGDGSASEEESNYPDRAVPIQRWQSICNQKTKITRMRRIPLERFTEKSILRAGLEVSCPHCAQRNWFDLKSMDYTLVCNRCLKEFSFPQGASDLRKMRWLYRVIGPFATPDFARGGYSVALALRTFAHGIGIGDHRLTWATGLELNLGPKKVEIDFAAWQQSDHLFRESEDPALIIGEAKSFGKEAIAQETLDDLKLVADRFPGAFIAVAVLKEHFSAKEKARLISLAKWGRRRRHKGLPVNPVIVLTGTELFSDWHVDAAWKAKGGRAKALVEPAYVDTSNILTFSELTQQLYLDLPPFSSDHMPQRRRRRAQTADQTPQIAGN
jgi:hypothetical protein